MALRRSLEPDVGVRLVNGFAVAGELHRDRRRGVEGLTSRLSGHIPDDRT